MPGSAIINLQNTYGAMFIGIVVATILSGLEIVQAWMYFCNYWNKDKRAFRIFIGILTVIDLLSTIMGAYAIHWYLISNFGDVLILGNRIWATNVQSILNIFPGICVQLYYVRRIYLLNRSLIGPIIVVPIILGANLFGIVIIVKELALKDNSNKISFPIWLLGIWMGSGVLADLLITGMMSWTLWRKRTGFARTDSIIVTLMSYTINSGFLMSALGTALTISFALDHTNYVYVPIIWVMGKCYMNSFYAMLNSRDYVRDRSTTGNPDNAYNTYNLSTLEPASDAYGTKSRQPTVTVTVHRSTTSDFPQSKSEHDVSSIEPTFEAQKPGDSEV